VNVQHLQGFRFGLLDDDANPGFLGHWCQCWV
jgi:hypothetical protein